MSGTRRWFLLVPLHPSSSSKHCQHVEQKQQGELQQVTGTGEWSTEETSAGATNCVSVTAQVPQLLQDVVRSPGLQVLKARHVCHMSSRLWCRGSPSM